MEIVAARVTQKKKEGESEMVERHLPEGIALILEEHAGLVPGSEEFYELHGALVAYVAEWAKEQLGVRFSEIPSPGAEPPKFERVK